MRVQRLNSQQVKLNSMIKKTDDIDKVEQIYAEIDKVKEERLKIINAAKQAREEIQTYQTRD